MSRPYHIDLFTQSFPKFSLERLLVGDPYVECAYPCDLGLLRARRQRPHQRRAADKRDKIPALHAPPPRRSRVLQISKSVSGSGKIGERRNGTPLA
jgi:hypothetical protein